MSGMTDVPVESDDEMVGRITRLLDAIDKGLDDEVVSLKGAGSLVLAHVKGCEGLVIVLVPSESGLAISLWESDDRGTPIFLRFVIGTLTVPEHQEMLERAGKMFMRGLDATQERGSGDFEDMMEHLEGVDV